MIEMTPRRPRQPLGSRAGLVMGRTWVAPRARRSWWTPKTGSWLGAPCRSSRTRRWRARSPRRGRRWSRFLGASAGWLPWGSACLVRWTLSGAWSTWRSTWLRTTCRWPTGSPRRWACPASWTMTSVRRPCGWPPHRWSRESWSGAAPPARARPSAGPCIDTSKGSERPPTWSAGVFPRASRSSPPTPRRRPGGGRGGACRPGQYDGVMTGRRAAAH
jgi:hypothetical protein